MRSVAVTTTAAILRDLMAPGSMPTPSRSSMERADCSVNGALRMRVAGSGKANDEAVAHELVVADALNRSYVLNPGFRPTPPEQP